MLNKFAGACKEFGLNISIKKTQVMGLDTSSVPTLHLEGLPLEVVNDFVYLGSNISSRASLDTEIKRRIAKAASTSTMSRLSKRVWDNKGHQNESLPGMRHQHLSIWRGELDN